ncbi:MAG: type II secretion system major pseudopilin GspG [Pseudomonadales bacterium]|nr:type II secretion system major pseudopilin GspG [Pseudomonadales bacterium]NRA18638.1 type II secretion system major pseudopilin GspG [Oceanospirillaceae bacterium]
MHNLKKTRSEQTGFTLLEIMVVILIIGLLGTIVTPYVLDNLDTAKTQKAKADIHNLELALDQYKLDNNDYPTTDQGIESLVKKPAASPEPRNYRPSGYIKRLQKDPWGNQYQYLQPGEHGAFDLYSLGKDNQSGGEGLNADIGNWTSN